MEQYRLCLAPLRFGAGIKGKLVDAMISQTPSITTSVGSEGMHQILQAEPWPGVVRDDVIKFADAALKLYNNEQEWLIAQKNGGKLLKARYDGKALGDQLMNRITEVEENLEQHRLNNFTGSMLKHHTMKSTQYMSQWIAAKNTNKSDSIDTN